MSIIRPYRITTRYVTLRRVQRGWNASEHLRLLLAERKRQGLPHTHQWLAAETGIRQGTISGYATANPKSRRNLGMDNAPKIAAALGVTLEQLGRIEDGRTESSTMTPAQIRQMLREEVEAALVPIEQLLQRLLDQAPPTPRSAGNVKR